MTGSIDDESVRRVEAGWRRELDRRPFVVIDEDETLVGPSNTLLAPRVSLTICRITAAMAMIGVSIFLVIWVFFLW